MSESPVTDETWERYNRGACGLHYVAHKMREMEIENNTLRKEMLGLSQSMLELAQSTLGLAQDKEELLVAINRVLASATPNQKNHPAMFAAWAACQAAVMKRPRDPQPGQPEQGQ